MANHEPSREDFENDLSFINNHYKKPPTLSFIEPYEEQVAKELIDQSFTQMTGKKFDMRPAGYLVALKIYVRPEELKTITRDDGTTATIYLPDVVRAEDKYQSCAALVCGMGPEAYQGDKFKDSGPWCKVGDWVMIPRYEATALSFRGVAMALLPDDRILAVIADPTDVESARNALDRF